MRTHYQDLKQVDALDIEEQSTLNGCTNLNQELSHNQEELDQDLKNDLTEQIKNNLDFDHNSIKHEGSIEQEIHNLKTVQPTTTPINNSINPRLGKQLK